MYYFRISFIIFYFIYLQQVNGFFSYISSGINYMICSFQECCDEYYIKKDIRELNERLSNKLFGQHIAHEAVISALSAHINTREPPKALVMSFHGTGGTGKNYVARMIMDTFYKRNHSSNFVHFFVGRADFRLESELDKYKEILMHVVVESLLKCPESLFIFDEVDITVPGLLNVLVPFMDYGIAHIWHLGRRVRVTTNKAIFIFLSNTGSQQIVDKMVNFWIEGKKSRDEAKLADFEDLISKGAFNELGGFHKSDTIRANLIDHYVPFLPLEKEHVIRCIEEAFKVKGKKPTSEQIEEVMEHISFGPENYNIYAKGGCKRIDSKVSSLLFRRRPRSEL